ncbi:LysE family translocator [Thalassotalea euphylliae]|uniref:LysE family translocator n=1 Tax=Thalassotalea euphylliae TaxID=1655234 RepID=A0A3E0TN93_9GAMM|nr:LysE family transporter [Thalassotalea euphylliae]REL25485.1 LysE family translocator [Thalassotalea euphylliae]
MTEIIAVVLITFLAVISPGADFALVTRNSYLYGRKAGLLTALGIGLGVQVHVFYTMIGIGFVIATQPGLFLLLKILGAGYLIYIGYLTFTSKPVEAGGLTKSASTLSVWKSLQSGFFTNALNPKTTLFVVSTYSQIVSPSTPMMQQYAYGVFMTVAHWFWFALVGLFFSNNRLRQKMLGHQQQVNRAIGCVLAPLGGLLVFSSTGH